MANAAKNAVKAATQAAKAPAKAPEAPASEDFSKFVGKLCKVTGGRNYVGETHAIFHVTKGSTYKKPVALANGKDDTVLFVNPKYLEIIGDMDAAEIKRLKDKQEAQKNETIYVAAYARSETDDGITLSYPGWARNIWFAKAKGDRDPMITLTGKETDEGHKIFEVSAWKIKKECGMDSYNALLAKQAELAKIAEG